MPLFDRLNGTKFVTETRADLPFLFILNGRKDRSIPWQNILPFYRALSDGAHGFAAYWDDLEHSTSGKDAPDDVIPTSLGFWTVDPAGGRVARPTDGPTTEKSERYGTLV